MSNAVTIAERDAQEKVDLAKQEAKEEIENIVRRTDNEIAEVRAEVADATEAAMKEKKSFEKKSLAAQVICGLATFHFLDLKYQY